MVRAPSTGGQEHLSDALDRVRDGVFTLDRNWNYGFVNRAGAAMVGRTVEELVGRSIWKEFPAAVGSVFEQRYREAMTSGDPVEFEELFDVLGSWFSIRVFPSASGLTIYYQDVTERRHAQDQAAARSAQQQALSELSLRTLAEPDLAVVIRDALSVVVRVLELDSATLQRADTNPIVVGRHAAVLGRGVEQVSTRFRLVVALPPWDAEAVGELVVELHPDRKLGDDAALFLESVAGLVSSRLQLDRRRRDAVHAARHDPLTALPNRQLLFEELAAMLQAGQSSDSQLALLVIGIDRFHLVNNSFGHVAGDELLVEVGARLRGVVGVLDVLARPGGDLFALALMDVDGDRDATAVARKLQLALEEPFSLNTGEHFLTTTIGIARASRESTPESLLRDAETALHEAKSERVAVQTFDEDSRSRAVRRVELDRQLHRAVARREFRVVYQPVFDLATEQPTGTEALVRWQHPDRGLLSPQDFVGCAEDTGLITVIGMWVLEQACRQTAAWQAQLGRPLEVCVNVSVRQVADPQFAQHVAAAAHRAGLLPGTLGLEITESLMLEESESSRGVLAALRELGIRLLLDDFGTGYSSLSYLKRFPVDAIKIDRSFITEITRAPQDAAIVDAVIQMGHAVNTTLVAEGVEFAAQRQLLHALGCDRAQGYFYSEPLPAEELMDILTSQTA